MTAIVRAHPGGFALRRVDGSPPTLTDHFSVFNQWATIDSVLEGKFLERVVPGVFSATFRDDRAAMRALFQHGKDPQVGDKPLGPLAVLEEDEWGARYEVPLLDTSYNRDLEPGLRAGVYGSSFRFKVVAEDWLPRAKRSLYNPDALPERTIRAAHVYELGPAAPRRAGAFIGGVRRLDGTTVSTIIGA